MEIEEEKIRYAAQQTEILRLPRQSLATFGVTNVNYFLLTKPVYADMVDKEETVIREGKVSAEKPRVITPSYLARLEGFDENARRYLEMAIREYGPHAPGLLYTYKNEPKELTIVSDRLEVVAGRLKDKIEREGDSLAAVIKGVDELWDVSLMKFISEVTENSLRGNVSELAGRGLLDVDYAGVPRDARYGIEALFQEAARGELDPSELRIELDRWGLFHEYEDRFLKLFRKGR